MFFSSSEGRKCSKCGVHKGICVYIYTYIYMQICQSQWKCSKYMVCVCSKYAKINGDILSICSLDVLSSHLEHFPMF